MTRYIFENQNNYPSLLYDRQSTPFKETIKTSGCGVCAVFNAVSNLRGRRYSSINTITTEFLRCSARTENGTDVGVGMRYLSSVYGGFSFKKADFKALKSHLKKGNTAILCTSGGALAPAGLFSTSGHYIAAVGAYEQGGVMYVDILDSGLYKGKYSLYGREKYARVSGNVVRVKFDTLQKCRITEIWLIGKALLKRPKLTVATHSKPLNIRRAAAGTSPVIGTAPKGAKVHRLGANGDFYHIKYKKFDGYSVKYFLK